MKKLKVYDGDENYIFITYSHKDTEKVEEILEKMQKNGLRIWYDSGIEAGQEWPEYIEQRLLNCSTLLVFMSEACVKSINCRNEINLALSQEKDLLIVYLEPTKLIKGMGLQLSAVQAINVHTYQTIDELVQALISNKTLERCKELDFNYSKLINKNQKIIEDELGTPGIIYEIEYDDSYKVVGYNGSSAHVVIPSTYKGLPVTTIDYAAFSNQEKQNENFCLITSNEYTKLIETITISKGVKYIYDWVFTGCENLRKLYIPNTIISIGENTLPDDPKKLLEIYYDGTIEEWCDVKVENQYEIRYYTNINVRDGKNNWYEVESLTIPKSVFKIGCHQFSLFSTLKSVHIPGHVKTIENCAFEHCNQLREITIDYGVEEIHDDAFSKCGMLENIYIPDSVGYIGNAFCDCTNLKKIRLPNKLSRVDSLSFYSCVSLKNIELPNYTIEIGEKAFYNCDSLESLYISKNIIKIGNNFVEGCKNLKLYFECDFNDCFDLIGLHKPEYLKSIKGVYFKNKQNEYEEYTIGSNGLTLVEMNDNSWGVDSYEGDFDSIIIPSVYKGRPVKHILEKAFENCSSLVNITIPDSIETIGILAFSKCSSLKSVAIPGTVKRIGDGAFKTSESLVTVNLMEGVTDIGNSVFSDCTSLKEIRLPDSLKRICFNTFLNCTSLMQIFIPINVRTIYNSAFKNCCNLKIYCEDRKPFLNKNPKNWYKGWCRDVKAVYWKCTREKNN